MAVMVSVTFNAPSDCTKNVSCSLTYSYRFRVVNANLPYFKIKMLIVI